MRSFSVSILTPEKIVYQGQVVSLIVPAALGFLGVLADHAPLAATLTKGKIVLREDKSPEAKTFFSNGKGFLEVLKNNATIFLESVDNN